MIFAHYNKKCDRNNDDEDNNNTTTTTTTTTTRLMKKTFFCERCSAVCTLLTASFLNENAGLIDCEFNQSINQTLL